MRIARFKPKVSKSHLIESIKERQKSTYNENDFYRPIVLSINGSNLCNISCCACYVSSVIKKKEATQFNQAKVDNLIEQAIDLGFIAYTLMVPAEPFLDISYHENVIRKYGKFIDCDKINTNSSSFTSYERAKSQFQSLKEVGWTDTNYLIPSLTLSLGMQQAEVPLRNLVWAILAFKEVFSEKEANLCVSHYFLNNNQFSTLNDLRIEYKIVTGDELEDEVLFKTNQLLKIGRGTELDEQDFKTYNLEEKVSFEPCFKLILDEYLEPGLYIFENGDTFSCVGFNPKKRKTSYNIHTSPLMEIINDINSSEFYRMVSSRGTRAVFDLVNSRNYLSGIQVTNRHEACHKIFELFQENMEI